VPRADKKRTARPRRNSTRTRDSIREQAQELAESAEVEVVPEGADESGPPRIPTPPAGTAAPVWFAVAGFLAGWWCRSRY
jgi:hypothetical protein